MMLINGHSIYDIIDTLEQLSKTDDSGEWTVEQRHVWAAYTVLLDIASGASEHRMIDSS